jgi:UDP-N-acetyl-2-amino-2-deoxyglucuronate dehydrogenase
VKKYEKLINSSAVDVVNICTPSGLHAKLAVRALNAGKNVMVEKPLGLNVKECDEVIQAAKQNKKICAVISQLRYSKSTGLVKKAIDEGGIGRPVEAGVYMKYYRAPEYYSSSKWRGTWQMDGGGALMNQGIHGVDLLLHFMGRVKSVQAITKTLMHKIEVEDTAIAIVEFENGAVGVIEGTTSVHPGYPRRFEICGTHGSIIMEEDRIIKWDTKEASDIKENKNIDTS